MKLVLATIALALGSSATMAESPILDTGAAADLQSAGIDWQGFYFGLNGDLGTLYSNQPVGGQNNAYFFGSDSIYGNEDVSSAGMAYGVGAGANAQFGSFVLGLDGDVSLSSFVVAVDEGYGYWEIKSDWNWYATLRGKAGLVLGNTLFYGTAGVAAVNATYGYCYYTGNGCGGVESEDQYDMSFTDTVLGATAGLGVEVALADNVTLKGEALYIGLPMQSRLTPSFLESGNETNKGRFTNSAVFARVGLNWHF